MNGTIDYYNQNADAFASGTANMAFKIVRNDITKMNTEAIVNTANDHPAVGTGCDSAVYKAAGYDEFLAYRTEKIGGFSTDLHRWIRSWSRWNRRRSVNGVWLIKAVPVKYMEKM